MIVIEMDNGHTIKLELDEKAAPITVANFTKLVEEGFYDGLTFHRIIKGFMSAIIVWPFLKLLLIVSEASSNLPSCSSSLT